MEQRKKRKLGEVDAAPAPADPQTKAPGADAEPAPAALQKGKVAGPKAAKANNRALKKARKEKKVAGTMTNPKQQLVRTVALGNLSADTRARAIEMARAAGEVSNASHKSCFAASTHTDNKRGSRV